MSRMMRREWTALTAESLDTVPATVGVFEIADADGRVLDVDYAGGRTAFGLRGVLETRRSTATDSLFFRYEVSAQYLTRYEELVLLHHGSAEGVPPLARARGVRGRGRIGAVADRSVDHPTREGA